MISQVFNMDCKDYMKTIEDKFFDLAIVDTPYGIGEDGRKNHTRSKLAKSNDYQNRSRYDNNPPDQEYFKELFRISKNQIIWGANHFISKIPFDSSCWIVWDKINGENDFADCELAWTSFKTAVRIKKFMWHGMMQGTPGNGSKMNGDKSINQKRIHPNEKPIDLYKWIYKKYLPAGGRVIDTHLGSGSNRIAAHDTGNVDFYATELDEQYFNDQEQRFAAYLREPKFDFAPQPELIQATIF